jgi:hypothetical protein
MKEYFGNLIRALQQTLGPKKSQKGQKIMMDLGISIRRPQYLLRNYAAVRSSAKLDS